MSESVMRWGRRRGATVGLVLVTILTTGPVRAADSGPRHHAEGAYDAAAGVYSVAPGDDLGDIARRFGVTVSALEQENNLESSMIQVDQSLSIPGEPASAAVAKDPDESAQSGDPASVGAATVAPAAPALPPDPWPRTVEVGDRTLEIYQPQVAAWAGNQLTLRAAIAVKPAGKGDEAFGTVQVQARTQVDKVQRQVILEDIKIIKAELPTLPDQGASLSTAAEQQLTGAIRIIPLDQLEASLGAAQATSGAGVEVRNAPPRVIVSYSPAVLVPIQGTAVIKPVPDTQLQRVINTRAVILTSGSAGPYYLHLLDGWVTAPALAGLWAKADIMPAGLDDVASRLAAEGRADLLNGGATTRPSICYPAAYPRSTSARPRPICWSSRVNPTWSRSMARGCCGRRTPRAMSSSILPTATTTS